MHMQTKIQKWGDSLAVRIPRAFVEEIQVAYGTSVDLSVKDGKLVMELHAEPVYTLDNLLQGVTEQNLHAEVETGGSVGQEAWQ